MPWLQMKVILPRRLQVLARVLVQPNVVVIQASRPCIGIRQKCSNHPGGKAAIRAPGYNCFLEICSLVRFVGVLADEVIYGPRTKAV